MRKLRCIYAWNAVAALTLGIYLVSGDLCGQDAFLRGDVDHDGDVSPADAVLLARALAARSALPCLDAADLTDNGLFQLGDLGLLVEYLVRGEPEPKAPFPSPGFDPTEDGLPCSQGEASVPQPDEATRYELSALPPGAGATGFKLRVSLESSRPLFGGRLVLSLAQSVRGLWKVLDRKPSLELQSVMEEDSVVDAHAGSDGKLRVLWLLSRSRFEKELAPRSSRPILDVVVCTGTTQPGEYPLEPEAPSEVVTRTGERWLVGATGASATVSAAGPECPERWPDASWARAYVYAADVRDRKSVV